MSRTTRKHWAEGYYTSAESYIKRQVCRLCHKIHVHNHDEYEPSYIEELRREYEAYGRDGRWSESGRKRAYKDFTNRKIRIDNRVKIKNVIDDIDSYDDLVFATKANGKYYAWCIW